MVVSILCFYSFYSFFCFVILGALDYAGRWSERNFDLEGVYRTIDRFIPIFRKHGVAINVVAVGSAPTVVEVEASFTIEEVARRREAEEYRRQMVEAEKLRIEEEATRAREQERSRRRAERDAYYLNLGIEPGPLAWLRALGTRLHRLIQHATYEFMGIPVWLWLLMLIVLIASVAGRR